jgi:hypothetical protein
MSEKEIEQAIQDKGLNAPRLTPPDIDAAIVTESFTTLPSGKVMVCELTLRNGFTARGEAATVSKANFNEEIGQNISRNNARNKVWELEGYLLQERLHRDSGGTWVDRVKAEYKELADRFAKLDAFLSPDQKPANVPKIQWDLMLIQHQYMRGYLDTLAERLNTSA